MASKKGGSSKAVESSWPSGTKIGLFGHENSGKTVYFTVLNEECKIAKDLQISVTDNTTAGEFLSNYRSIWGLSTEVQTGTVVDQRGEKKFPDPTARNRILQFTAILDRSRKIPVVSLDYGGKAVSISEQSELSEQVIQFMTACDGILFFFDPKILGAEIETQARSSAFVNILERIASLKSRIPIPIGLVINKADTLPGFQGESQTVLIDPENEQFIAEDFDLFLEKVLNSNKIVADSTWAASVRNVLVKLREFLRVVVGRTLNFQVFFVSNTGNAPVKIGADVGRSVYAPPEKINPSGVKEPFYWILNSIVRNKRLNFFRKIAKYTAAASLIWVILYSLPFVYHFSYLLSKPYAVENTILKTVDNNHLNTSPDQRNAIVRAYSNYERGWLVRNVFPGYKLAAGRMIEIYKDFNVGKAIATLDNVIGDFTNIVRDSTQWPKLNPSKDSLVFNDKHTALLDELNRLHIGDESSVLYMRSDRTLTYWDLFTQYLKSRNDTTIAASLQDQILFDQDNAPNYGKSEQALGKALNGIAQVKKKTVAKQVDSQKGLTEYEGIKKRINGSSDPAFILGGAVRELKSIKGKLIPGVHDKQIAAINDYLKKVEKYDKLRTYKYKIEAIPDMGHIHVEVTKDGESPTWSNETQMLEGDSFEIKWAAGRDIHIAFDELKHKCQWGEQPSDKIVLKDKYSLFEMEGNITFPNIGKTITISFEGGLKDNLPKLK